METGLGMGFFLGVLAGLVAAIIAVVIFAAKRAHTKSVRRRRSDTDTDAGTRAETREIAAAAAAAGVSDATRVLPPRPAPARAGTTMVISPVPANRTTVREAPASASASDDGAARRKEPGGNTIIVEAVENRDRMFSASVQEVRDMLLTLADLIARTETASGAAADVFNSARDTVHSLSSAPSPDLRDAQRLLLAEIDRVLSTNAALHADLDRANKGIAEQRRQIEELRVQARIDALTRIPNRAAFDERLTEFISHLKRSGLAFCLLILDIDHFKRVNDDHGHICGDRILRGIASKLSGAIRNNDFAARYGGEEFAVIFPGTSLADALPVADRIRADIAKTNFRLDQKTLKITISGGIAQCFPDMTQTQIVAAADAALYAAKNAGRNRILPAAGAETSI